MDPETFTSEPAQRGPEGGAASGGGRSGSVFLLRRQRSKTMTRAKRIRTPAKIHHSRVEDEVPLLVPTAPLTRRVT
jgi:hypothetical protein